MHWSTGLHAPEIDCFIDLWFDSNPDSNPFSNSVSSIPFHWIPSYPRRCIFHFSKIRIYNPKLAVEDPQFSASLLCWCFDWCELYVDVLCWSKSLCKIFISTLFSLLNIEFYLAGWRRKSIRAADRWVEWQGQGYYILGRRSMGCIRTHLRLNASVYSTYGVSQIKLQLAITNRILRAILGDQIWGKSEPKYHHGGPKWPKLA